jgi:hypothetical protein
MTFLLLAASLAAAPVSMEHLRVDLSFTLVHADGKAEPKPMQKAWYFEVPTSRADDKSMTELLHRIFWDMNVAMREREPGDHAYLSMVSFKSSKVDLAAVKASKGADKSGFGWLDAQRDVVWEASAEFIVDAKGHYDNIGANDYTELLLHRMFERKLVSEAEFVAFFDAYNTRTPGRTVFDDREKRLKSLTEIRGTVTNAPGSGPTRKAPGARPIASGPIDAVKK